MGRSPALVSLFIMKQILGQGFRTHQLIISFYNEFNLRSTLK
jgi:hypothetical protein